MSSPDDVRLYPRLRVMQIIAGALLLGVVLFLAIVLVIVSGRPQGPAAAPAGGLPLVSVVAVVLLAVEAPLAFLVPGLQTRNALRQIASGTWRLPPGASAAELSTDTAKLLAVRQTTMLIG